MPLTIVPVFSSLTRLDIKNRLLEGIKGTGTRIKEINEPYPQTDRQAPIYIFVGSGGTENTIAQYISKQKDISSVVLISHHSNNSLPAALETKTWMQKNNIECKLVHDTFGGILKKIERWNHFAYILNSVSPIPGSHPIQ
jgi:hypothetical protein